MCILYRLSAIQLLNTEREREREREMTYSLYVFGDFAFSLKGKRVLSSVNKVFNVMQGCLFRSQQEDSTNLCFLSQSCRKSEWKLWGVDASQYLAIKRENSSSIPRQILCCCPYETFCHFSALEKIYYVLVF